MDRRDSLKALGLSSLTIGFLLNGCKPGEKNPVLDKDSKETYGGFGRYEAEIERFKMLDALPDYFDDHEMATITVLSDIIIPADEKSGSASDAKVPEFIAFMAKDRPDDYQLPVRGGIRWLDRESLNRFGKVFTDLPEEQRIKIIDDIAYPEEAKPEMKQGVAFFDLMRDLVASGFYTTKIGIDDIGYKGNRANQWKGVPEDVLKDYAKYDLKGFDRK